jgi:hypothetical protein
VVAPQAPIEQRVRRLWRGHENSLQIFTVENSFQTIMRNYDKFDRFSRFLLKCDAFHNIILVALDPDFLISSLMRSYATPLIPSPSIHASATKVLLYYGTRMTGIVKMTKMIPNHRKWNLEYKLKIRISIANIHP